MEFTWTHEPIAMWPKLSGAGQEQIERVVASNLQNIYFAS
jgi:hypothetical protein